MNPEQFIQQTLTDIKVKLEGEFKENFTRKAFFDEKWKTPKFSNSRGSMMLRSGNLRNSIISKIQGNSIIFSSSMPYADIHNNGGEIKVTPKMKKYFWAMYLQSTGAMGKRKNGELRQDKRNRMLSAQAQMYKILALKKVGETIKIEKRQFIGHHEKADTFIKEIINHNLEELKKEMDKLIKRK